MTELNQIDIVYNFLDLQVQFDCFSAPIGIFVYSGRKNGSDQYTELKCFNEQATKEIYDLARSALREELEQRAEHDNYIRTLREQCYETPYAY